MLDGDAVKAVATLAVEAATVQQVAAELPGGKKRVFTDKKLHEIDTEPKMPTPVGFGSLSAFRDYLLADEAAQGLLICVQSPTKVVAISKLEGIDKHQRRHVANAECSPGNTLGFSFNRFVEMADFNIALQTCFVPNAGRIDQLRSFCGGVKADTEVRLDDDGVSQAVSAKAGVAAVATVQVKNPWDLAPWRTFAEVEQPLSPFILRYRRDDGPVEAGLFETGNQQWKVDAVAKIAGWLRIGMPGWTVLG